MKYSKSYIDKYFDSIENYDSKIELLSIAQGEADENQSLDWVVEMSEIMNWQAMSDRSGVWTYYEVVNNEHSQLLIRELKGKNEIEILQKYLSGIGKYEEENLMDQIDSWIQKNEEKIYRYIENILICNKSWFYGL